MSFESYKVEVAERERRKKQMLVCDENLYRERNLEDIRNLVKKVTKINVAWKLLRKVNDKEMLVEVEIFDDKVDLVKRRDEFRPYRVYFKDNRTAREQEVTNWLKEMCKREQEQGRQASVGHQKIRVAGVWNEWNEKKGRLEVSTKRTRH